MFVGWAAGVTVNRKYMESLQEIIDGAEERHWLVGMVAEDTGCIHSLKEIWKMKRETALTRWERFIKQSEQKWGALKINFHPGIQRKRDPGSGEPATNSEPPVCQFSIPRWQGAVRMAASHCWKGPEVFYSLLVQEARRKKPCAPCDLSVAWWTKDWTLGPQDFLTSVILAVYQTKLTTLEFKNWSWFAKNKQASKVEKEVSG